MTHAILITRHTEDTADFRGWWTGTTWTMDPDEAAVYRDPLAADAALGNALDHYFSHERWTGPLVISCQDQWHDMPF